MTTDYNQGRTAEQYKQAKEQPWRSRIEGYSLMNRIGALQGLKVVDIACGEGHITRQLRQGGAREVLGVDISKRMIQLAQSQEDRQQLGIEYRVGDARDVVSSQDFDLAVSAWLLVYARDRAELNQMCRGVASWLRPGGRFVTFTTNPDLYHFEPRVNYQPYGFEIALAERVHEGAPIWWRIPVGDSTLEIENYYLPISAYEKAFRAAGFRSCSVLLPELSPPPDGIDDSSHWADFLRHPPAILFDCVKA
ncbi:class I SAM-dependent methyltransferase [Planctomicrobium sp. SH664]|uniref:class I SAM-dependent methyltransferase n=1 Tax=Planctomicrobium sp. SH664 TaxID=3448125 RepID=UPI003F5B14EE